MLALVQFFVFYIVVPLIYLAILLFDYLLIAKARTLENRLRSLGGILTGFLMAVVVILLDLNYGPLVSLPPQSSELQEVWLSAAIFALIGFILLLMIDFLLRRGIVPFVIMFTITGTMLSVYFMVRLSAIRTMVAISTIGFLVGTITYFIIFPSRISSSIRGK